MKLKTLNKFLIVIILIYLIGELLDKIKDVIHLIG